MKITHKILISALFVSIAPKLFAQSVCENTQVLQDLTEHVQRTTFDEAEDYLLRRSVQLTPFVYQYLKQDTREFEQQIRHQNLALEQIIKLQLARYGDIYQQMNQQFIKKFQQKEQQEGDQAYFFIVSAYEQLLQPIIAQQLAKHQADLITTLQDVPTEDYDLYTDIHNQMQQQNTQLQQLLAEKLPLQWHEIQENKTQKLPDGILVSCQRKLSWSTTDHVVLHYEVSQWAKTQEIFLVPMYLSVNEQQMAYDAIGSDLLKRVEQKMP